MMDNEMMDNQMKNSLKDKLLKYKSICELSFNLINDSELEERSTLNNKTIELQKDIEDQLKLLDKPNYEIAVVGCEKAGKSSLLNAWIGFNLLPSGKERCTYTTIEIRSCSDVSSEQRYQIQYFTSKEFEEKYQQLKDESASMSSNLRDKTAFDKEIEEIEQHMERIRTFLDRPVEEKKFQRFEEVKDKLSDAIQKPELARAIKKLCIWTTKFLQKQNIVLYDVPGYNSPITLHKEQTRAKIAEVDAILFATRMDSPSLVDSEIEILKISDKTNPYVQTKDKIVVALTFCDQVNPDENNSKIPDASLKSHYQISVLKNIAEWQIHGIDASKVIPVSAAGELPSHVMHQDAMKRLHELNEGKTGFKELKEAVTTLMQKYKTTIAVQRCTQLLPEINSLSTNVIQKIKTKFDFKGSSDFSESFADKLLFDYWNKLWDKISKDLNIFFQDYLLQKKNSDDIAFLNCNPAWLPIIIEEMKRLFVFDQKEMERIYKSYIEAGQVISVQAANKKIRDEVIKVAYSTINTVTDIINDHFWNDVNYIFKWIYANFVDMPEIKQKMLKDDDQEKEYTKRCFNAIVKSLARPAAETFLRFPRVKEDRMKIIQEYQIEIGILNKYVEKDTLKEQGLFQYIANGKMGSSDFRKIHETLLFNNQRLNEEESGNSELNAEREVKPEKSKSSFFRRRRKSDKSNNHENDTVSSWNLTKENEKQFSLLEFSHPAKCESEVIKEIQEDMQHFLLCAESSMFFGSGVVRYYYQELDDYREKFLNSKQDWQFYFIKDAHFGKIKVREIGQCIEKRQQISRNVFELENLLKELKN